jgi:hypothetical protein
MDADDLLFSRNARPEKGRMGVARCPSCSQNAHDETVLVRCAQGERPHSSYCCEWGGGVK